MSDEVIGFGRAQGLSLITTKGQEILRQDFNGGDWLSEYDPPPVPSANGQRLAVAVVEHKGEIAFLDTDYHIVPRRIMVFDIPGRKWVLTLNTKRQKMKALSGLALSPDGTRLAIIADGVVEVYQLPVGEFASGIRP